MALVSDSTIKSFLGITSTSEDALIAILNTQAEYAFKAEVGRDIEQTSYPGAATGGKGDSGLYSGLGQRILNLRQYPVIRSGLTVYLDQTGRFDTNPDGSFATATLLVEGTDYVLRVDGCLPGTTTKCSYSGQLERVSGTWPAHAMRRIGELTAREIDGGGNIKVAYTAGYPTVPADIQGAICQMVGWMRRNGEFGGVQMSSQSMGGYSYSLGQLATSQVGTAAAVIAKYKSLWI